MRIAISILGLELVAVDFATVRIAEVHDDPHETDPELPYGFAVPE